MFEEFEGRKKQKLVHQQVQCLLRSHLLLYIYYLLLYIYYIPIHYTYYWETNIGLLRVKTKNKN